MELAEQIYRCEACGLVMDRDRNAASNLAAWAEAASKAITQAPDRQAGGRVTNAPGGEGTGHRFGDSETGPSARGTDSLVLTGAGQPRRVASDNLPRGVQRALVTTCPLHHRVGGRVT
jgi:putative transposase